MLSFLEVGAQVVAAHRAFSCNKMVKCQSSVLAGDSGDRGKQLRQGCGAACRGGTVEIEVSA
jgi:hypothetical protein